MTTIQRKEVFDKFKIVVGKIIFEREFNPPPDSIRGEEFFERFNDKFKILESLIIKGIITSNKTKIIKLFDEIYNQNWEEILQLAYAGGTDINVRTMNVIDFVINKVEELPEYNRYNVLNNWEEYKEENPSGGRRRRFRTKKRKTKKYKRMSKRNRKI